MAAPRRYTRKAAALASLGLTIAACSGGGGGTVAEPVTGAIDVTVRAQDPKYAYDQKTYNAKAGTINIELINDGKENHNLVIQGVDKKKFKLLAQGPGAKVSGSVQLQANTYTIYCDLSGHRAGGMEAKLVVS